MTSATPQPHILVSINGAVSSSGDGQVSIWDRGLQYGDGVYETMVAFGATVLDLPVHLARLQQSAEAIGMELPWRVETLEFEIRSLVESAGHAKARIKIIVTRGNDAILSRTSGQPNRYITVQPAMEGGSTVLDRGLKLMPHPTPYLWRGAHPKLLGYSLAAGALAKATAGGFDDVMWSNPDQEVTESSIANIFFIGREGNEVELITPATHSGLLEGITRNHLLKILPQEGIETRSEVVFADHIPKFDEAFVTSTVRGLVPITYIGKHRLHSAHPKSIFRSIYELYMRDVARRVGHRVNWQTGRRE